MRLVLCDRHRLFAESFAHVLETLRHEVWAVSSPEDATETVGASKADACLMELDFGSQRVLSAIEAMRSSNPETRVVILSSVDDPRVLTPVLAAGVAGVVSKEQGLNHILDTLSRLMTGPPKGTNGIPAAVAARSTLRGPRRGISDLTPREQEVLRHLALGHGTGFLARSLGVSYSTARTHIQNVLAKLEVHSRLEAVALVHQQNMPASFRQEQDQAAEQAASPAPRRMVL
jgi:DNA-binding NarL/FixJ family response regulator